MSKRRPKAKAAKPKPIDRRKQRAYQNTEHVTLANSWIAHITTAAYLAAHEATAQRLAVHRKRCDTDLVIALLLAREWTLDATGTGRCSDVPDPTGNAAIASLGGHTRNEYTALCHLITQGVKTTKIDQIARTADLVERLIDQLDIDATRTTRKPHDRETMHADNIGRGCCARCTRWCEGRGDDRLKTTTGTHRLCDTCRKAWQRRTDTDQPIEEWIAT